MFFKSGHDFLNEPEKKVCIIGMSGVGKTHLASMLRESGWFQYSVDYRIGTRYLGENILDQMKSAAMREPLLENLLRADAIGMKLKLGFHNLGALTAYLGKVGALDKEGLPLHEFFKRQEQHHSAETNATMDHKDFIERSKQIYGYTNFVCDTSGSFCSIVEPENDTDPILSEIARKCIIIYIEGNADSREALLDAFRKSPKPIFYSKEFFRSTSRAYLNENGGGIADVDPDHFAKWAFERLIDFRLPRYEQIAKKWGYTIPVNAIRSLLCEHDLIELIAKTIDGRAQYDYHEAQARQTTAT